MEATSLISLLILSSVTYATGSVTLSPANSSYLAQGSELNVTCDIVVPTAVDQDSTSTELSLNGTNIQDIKDSNGFSVSAKEVNGTQMRLVVSACKDQADVSDSGTYSCVAKYSDGTSEEGKTKLNVFPVTVSHDVINRSEPVLKCRPNLNAQEFKNLTVNWRKVGSKSHSGHKMNKTMLHFHNPGFSDAGKYLCEMTLFGHTSAVPVYLVGMKAYRQKQDKFRCEVLGPDGDITWENGNVTIVNNTDGVVYQSHDGDSLFSILTIKNTNDAENTMVSCVYKYQGLTLITEATDLEPAVSSEQKLPIAIIAGAIAAVVLLILVIIFIVVCFMRSRKRRGKAETGAAHRQEEMEPMATERN